MEQIKREMGKIIKSPMLWIVAFTFFMCNIKIVNSHYGYDFISKSLKGTKEAMCDYGLELNKHKNTDGESSNEVSDNKTDGNKNDTNSMIDEVNNVISTSSNTETDENQNTYYSNYVEYVDQNSDMYEELDMMEVLESKKEELVYNPTGAYGDFIEKNYEKLNERVDEIRDSKEGDYGFYPGQIYKTHSVLYGSLFKYMALEGVILVMLSILLIMDYERIHKTRDVVIVTKTGKAVMRKKIMVGLLAGLTCSVILIFGSLLYYFSCISYKGLMNIPMSSSIMAENGYPFITFWKMTVSEYLIMNIVVGIMLILVVAGITVALQLMIQNSYITFIAEGLMFMILYLVANWNTVTFFDVIKNLLNPVFLWNNIGSLFMESHISLAFKGNELMSIVACCIVIAIFALLGRRRYLMMEIR